jgi:hypothetical protein
METTLTGHVHYPDPKCFVFFICEIVFSLHEFINLVGPTTYLSQWINQVHLLRTPEYRK